MTGVYTAAAAEVVGDWAATSAGTAAITAAGTAVVGAGVSRALAPSSKGINIPPPPGAAMIDPAGAQAAAQERRRQADAGGLASTQTGAGNAPASGTATSGSKSLLGS